MKSFIIALAVCSLWVSNPSSAHTAILAGQESTAKVFTQDPVEEVAELVVEGPTKAKVGDLVVISVEKSRASSFKWIMLPSTSNFLVIDGGKRVVFSSGVGGEFRFIVACSLGDTCDVAVHTVTVIGSAPGPVDNLASKVSLWCDSVESDTKRDDCLGLAQSFSSVALVMEGGSLTTPEEIVRATIKSNQDALGDKLENWLPFRSSLSKELSAMAGAGKLTDTQSHIKVWKAIAAGLRQYAATL